MCCLDYSSNSLAFHLNVLELVEDQKQVIDKDGGELPAFDDMVLSLKDCRSVDVAVSTRCFVQWMPSLWMEGM